MIKKNGNAHGWNGYAFILLWMSALESNLSSRVFILFPQYFIYSIVHGYIVHCSEKLETICCLKNKRLDYSLPVALILKQYWNNCVEILIDKAK